MKKHICLLVFAALVAALPVFGVEIVPKPVSVVETGVNVQLSNPLSFNVVAPELKGLVPIWSETFAPIATAYYAGSTDSADVLLLLDESMEAEEYSLVISDAPNKVVVKGGSAAGVWWGMQTLAQILLQSSSDDGFSAPCVNISDKPLFAYRGGMLDCGRHFFTVGDVKRFIDILALHKLNIFHWHLTEDQGWRIEIKKYPLLTEVGSMRKETIKTLEGYPSRHDGFDGIPHGGYYSQDDIRDIVKYATDRHVTIIPEIEMPGHSLAILASYPELGCRGEGYEVATRWGVFNDILCAGNEKTIEFLEGVLDEVCELFPSEYIHVGGDEAPVKCWEECPKCQAKKQELGLEKTEYLHGYLLKTVEKYLNEKGRKIIGWDEVLDAGVTPTATIMSWRMRADGANRAAQHGNDVIMTPIRNLYFSIIYPQDLKEEERNEISLPFSSIYSFDPFAEANEETKSHIKGIQGNLWTELVGEFSEAERMFLPRGAVLSELAWGSEKEDSASFRQRVIDVMFPLYDALGLNYAKYGLDE